MGRKKHAPAKQRSHSAAARRRKKNERKYAFSCGMVLLLLLSIGVVLSLTVFFPIERVTVTGSTHYADGDLIEATGLSPGDNLFYFSAGTISKRLIQKFPYIEHVKVTRDFPNAVALEVREARVETAIETEAGFLLLDRRGRILEPPSAYPPEGSPRVIGFSLPTLSAGDYLPNTERERFDLLLDLSQEIAQSGLSPISIIDLRDPIEMKLLYDGRIAIELGSRIELGYKLRAAAEILRLSVGTQTVASLDVSVRPTMRLREINIYAAEHWPFPEALRADYEREISPKPERPSPPAKPESSPQAPTSSAAPIQPPDPPSSEESGDSPESERPLVVIEA